MNFGVSVVVFVLETVIKVLAWALGLKLDAIEDPDENLQENIKKSETVAATTDQEIEEFESREEQGDQSYFKHNSEIKEEGTNISQNIEHGDNVAVEATNTNQIIEYEGTNDEDQKRNPDLIVTNPVVEAGNLNEIENMFSQMNLNSSQNEGIDDENMTTPDKQTEDQLFTPESKHPNQDEENSLFKKMRQQREKLEGDRSPMLEYPSHQFQDVTPENKKSTEPEEESTLLKKLKQQRDKIDTLDSADGPNQIDMRINTFKHSPSVSLEDALTQKLNKQLKKIDDNIQVEEVKAKSESKSLVEDALGEKLKKQQLKIDGFYEAVVENTSHHEAESLVEDALAEKLKKRRSKIDEGGEEIDATLRENDGQKSSLASWEKGGTLDRKLRKQRQKIKAAEMTDEKASSENVDHRTDGVEEQIKDAMQDFSAEVKLKDMDEAGERMSSLVEPATQITRTRE